MDCGRKMAPGYLRGLGYQYTQLSVASDTGAKPGGGWLAGKSQGMLELHRQSK